MSIKLTPLQKKVFLAGFVALSTAVGEVGYQLVSGTVNLTKAAILGLAMGVLARVGGAVLAAITTNRPDEPVPSIDTARRESPPSA